MYDPVADVWTSIPNMTRARNGAGAAVIGDNLYAIGKYLHAVGKYLYAIYVGSCIMYAADRPLLFVNY